MTNVSTRTNRSWKKTFSRQMVYEWENAIELVNLTVLTRLACDRSLSLLALRPSKTQENRNVFVDTKRTLNAVKDVIDLITVLEVTVR